MDPQQIIILTLSGFFISIISSLAGFGGGILMILVFSFFMDIKSTIAFSSIFFLMSNSNKVALYHKTVDWKFLKNLMMGAIPGVIAGLLLFKHLPDRPIEIFLGILGLYLIAEHFINIPSIKNFTPLKIAAGGSLWGIATGSANGMPIKVMLLKWYGLKKHLFVGTSAVMSWVIDIFKLFGYFFLGFLTLSDLGIWVPILFAASILGSWIGKQILNKISIAHFDWIMLTMIFFGSLKFLWP